MCAYHLSSVSYARPKNFEKKKSCDLAAIYLAQKCDLLAVFCFANIGEKCAILPRNLTKFMTKKHKKFKFDC